MRPDLRRKSRQLVRAPRHQPARVRQIRQSFLNGVYHLMGTDLGEGAVKLAASECFPLESLVLLDLGARTRLRAVERIAWAAQTDREDRWRIGAECTDLSEDTRSQLRPILRQPQAGD